MTWTLRTALVVILAAISVLAVAAAAAVAVVQGRHALEERIIDDQRSAGNGAAAAVTSLLESAGHSLASTAALIDDGSLRPSVDAGRVAVALDPLVAYSQAFSRVGLVDAEGHVLVSRPGGPAPPTPPDVAAAVQAAHRDGAPILSLPGPAPYWVAPVVTSGGPPYALAAAVDLSQLRSRLFSTSGDGLTLLLVDGRGTILVATRPGLEGRSLAGWAPWADLAVQPHVEGTIPGMQERSFATRTYLQGLDASVVALSGTGALRGLTASLVGNALLTSLVMLAVILPAGVFLTAYVTRPVRKVEQATRRMRQGDLKARVEPGGARELRELAVGFNAMAGQLERDRDGILRMQAHLETQVAERTAELRQRNKDLESFAYIVSHDLRAPLRGLHFHLELLEESLGARPPASSRKEMHAIRERADRLAGLIDDVLEYSRKGRPAEAVEDLDLEALVREAVAGLPLRKGIRIQVAPLPRIQADRTQALQVFQNLIGNALQHHG